MSVRHQVLRSYSHIPYFSEYCNEPFLELTETLDLLIIHSKDQVVLFLSDYASLPSGSTYRYPRLDFLHKHLFRTPDNVYLYPNLNSTSTTGICEGLCARRGS